MSAGSPRFRSVLAQFAAYRPGRQVAGPDGRSFQLASNESPFGPLPSVMAAIAAASAEVNRYPDNAAAALTQAVAEHLSRHPLVTWVKYPGLPSSPYHALAKKYLPRGSGAIMTFGIKGGLQAGRRFIDSVKLFSHLANLCDSKSLVIHPASTTHQQLSEAHKAAAGITDDLVRLSVGIEDLDDILWDLDQALEASQR